MLNTVFINKFIAVIYIVGFAFSYAKKIGVQIFIRMKAMRPKASNFRALAVNNEAIHIGNKRK